AIAFTGGVGEHSAEVRTAVCDRLAWLGVEIHADGNNHGVADREIGTASSTVRVCVITSREDLAMAAEARSLLGP
ncbi:MAG: acetate kinase, partial [Nocardioidaceae bacterium]